MHIPAAHPEWAEWTINKEMVSTNRVDGPAEAGPFFLESGGQLCSYIVV